MEVFCIDSGPSITIALEDEHEVSEFLRGEDPACMCQVHAALRLYGAQYRSGEIRALHIHVLDSQRCVVAVLR